MHCATQRSTPKSRRLSEDLQVYRNGVYIAHLLDDGVFDALNASPHTDFLYRSGALDAPELIPAGSMRTVTSGWHDMSFVERGVSLQEALESDRIAEEIIDEILNDEASDRCLQSLEG